MTYMGKIASYGTKGVGVVVSVTGPHQGRGSLVTAPGPPVSHGITASGFITFLGLERKHSGGLDFIFGLTETLSLWSKDRGFVPKIV